jgi:acyl carrier protein phosphodiesterase
MNWLAHLFLSLPDPEERLGQVLADVVRMPDRGAWTPGVSAGAAKHQQIDRFTDEHPIFKQSRARLSSPRRRYGGIIIDIFYDHFLTRQWDAWSAQPLGSFLAQIERDLRGCATAADPVVSEFLDRLFGQRWLWDYGTVEGLSQTFRRISCRLSRHPALHGAEEELREHYAALEQDFNAFMPDLCAFVRSYGVKNGPQR